MYFRLCIMKKRLLPPKLMLIDTIDKILPRRCADYKSTRFTKMDCSIFDQIATAVVENDRHRMKWSVSRGKIIHGNARRDRD